MIQIPKKIKTVIFDLDGTLVDSMGMWKDIDVAFLGRFGISLPETFLPRLFALRQDKIIPLPY